jgi:endonuclease/exonuclease/phosphatase family metal-dependent hydrolase
LNVKVLTMNIHHGRGTDRQVNLRRIAGVLRSSQAEIIGLNEVDRCFSRRSQFADQAAWLAEHLGMNLAFGPSLSRSGKEEYPLRQYGNALLSAYPIVQSRNVPYGRVRGMASRSLLDAQLRCGKETVRVMVTHLSLYPLWRRRQVRIIAERLRDNAVPVIVMGDFNMRPGSGSWREMTAVLQDASAALGKTTLTFPADRPRQQLDYIFVSGVWMVEDVAVFAAEPAASDHLPLAADLRFAASPLS